ncbi:MAG: hypothetical protein PVJ92_01545, partial [Candidatus Dependentiae bacterium]
MKPYDFILRALFIVGAFSLFQGTSLLQAADVVVAQSEQTKPSRAVRLQPLQQQYESLLSRIQDDDLHADVQSMFEPFFTNSMSADYAASVVALVEHIEADATIDTQLKQDIQGLAAQVLATLAEEDSSWWANNKGLLIGGGVAAAVLVITVAVMLMRRRAAAAGQKTAAQKTAAQKTAAQKTAAREAAAQALVKSPQKPFLRRHFAAMQEYAARKDKTRSIANKWAALVRAKNHLAAKQEMTTQRIADRFSLLARKALKASNHTAMQEYAARK